MAEGSATNWFIYTKAERSKLCVMTIKVIVVVMVMIVSGEGGGQGVP